jgi:hypothetical protein
MGPEATAKPIGLIVPREAEMAEWRSLSTEQHGYFLHWVRSNQRYAGDWWKTALRKAREQRPA